MKQSTTALETIIEAAFEQRSKIDLERAEGELREAILESGIFWIAVNFVLPIK